MSQDVAVITSRLSPLSEAGKTVQSLETLVKDKPIPRRPMGQAMAGLLRKASAGPALKKMENRGKEIVNGSQDEELADEDEDGVGMMEESTPTVAHGEAERIANGTADVDEDSMAKPIATVAEPTEDEAMGNGAANGYPGVVKDSPADPPAAPSLDILSTNGDVTSIPLPPSNEPSPTPVEKERASEAIDTSPPAIPDKNDT